MRFSKSEDDVILTKYRTLGAAGIIKAGLLPGRSRNGIKNRARDLGVRHHQWEIEVPPKPERWWDYAVESLGVAPRAVLS